MSATDVLNRFGPGALLRLVTALVAYLLCLAVRAPFVLVARLLDATLRRIDTYLITAVTTRREGCTHHGRK